MAVFKSILGEVRGSIAGSTFSRNGNSAYIRNKAIPVNPRSTGQTEARLVLATISALWRSLTQAQQTAWKALAVQVPYTNKVGDSSTYSGFQLFMKCNMVARGLFSGTILNPPASPPTFPGVTFGGLQAEQDAADFNMFTLSSGAVLIGSGTGFSFQYQTTGVVSAGRNFVNESEYRTTGFTTPAATLNPVPLTLGWTDTYGTPSASIIGDAIFFRARMVHSASGFVSPWFESKAIVVEA